MVANAVAALSEISDVSTSAAEALELNSQTVNKLCTALNECTEYVSFFCLTSKIYRWLEKSHLQSTTGSNVLLNVSF